MRKIIFLLVLFPYIILAQTATQTENYVKSTTYTIPVKMLDSLALVPNDDKNTSIQYFDGLGRAKQSIAINAGGSREDIITHYTYDAYGRQTKDYLPYSNGSSNGQIRTGDVGLATQTFYKNKYPLDFAGVTLPEDANAFSEKEFEASPLNRVLKQAAPGAAWKLGSGHEIQFDYQTNTHDPANTTNPANDNVRMFSVSLTASYAPSLDASTFYAAAELYKTVTKDENWTTGKNHTTEEFKDKQGQVLLKRSYANINNISTAHDTYYVYDDYGNLTYVLPPKVNLTDGVSTSELANLCYQYQYDSRNRLVEKQIPGKEREYIVYDKLDRPVMTRDALNPWMFTKYDVFGRVVYTGVYTGIDNITTIKSTFDSKTPEQNYETKVTTGTGVDGSYYTNANYPDTNIEVLTVNYYDNYTFNRAGATTSISSFGKTSTTNLKGLATGSRVKVLDTDNWITTVSYYDEKARNIYAYSKNDYLETVDISEFKLDFIGRTTHSRIQHTKAGTTIVTLDNFNYDHAGRLLSQVQCLGDETLGYDCSGGGNEPLNIVLSQSITTSTSKIASNSVTLKNGFHFIATTNRTFSAKIADAAGELIVSNTYDELGQLESKKVGNSETNPLQDIAYDYNVRGWLRGINDVSNTNKLFNFKLDYNTGSGVHLFNGNISATSWRTANTDSSLKSYAYSYNALNRITAATGANSFSNYDVSGISYDKMGNIMSLTRQGHVVDNPVLGTASDFGVMDNLSYSYDSGNRLMKVTDAATLDKYGFKDDAVNTATDSLDDYSYDLNGNMISDANKGIIEILYNHLNLPTKVTIVNTEHNGNIEYVYDATGVKLRKTVSDGTTQSYAGNYIYKNNVLEFFNHPEGYVNNNNGAFEYVYQYKDHLGNVRLSYQDADNNGVIDAATEIIDEKNYYPFGLTHKGYNNIRSPLGNGVAGKFGYNGIELEEGLGLELYEMDLRQYDPAIARFTSIDPVTHHSMSPYVAFDSNPVFWADPSGANAACPTCGEAKDVFGRNRYDENNMYIPPHERGNKSNSSAKNGDEGQQSSDMPQKIDLRSKDKNEIVNRIIEWAIYIRKNRASNNNKLIYLSNIIFFDKKSQMNKTAKIGLRTLGGSDVFETQIIYDDQGNSVEIGYDKRYMKSYFDKGNTWDIYVDSFNDYGYLEGSRDRYHLRFSKIKKDKNGNPPTLLWINFTGKDFYERVTKRIYNPVENQLTPINDGNQIIKFPKN